MVLGNFVGVVDDSWVGGCGSGFEIGGEYEFYDTYSSIYSSTPYSVLAWDFDRVVLGCAETSERV